MTQDKLEKYREKLLELKKKYEEELMGMEKEYLHSLEEGPVRDISGYSIHLADSASDTYEKEKNVELITNVSEIIEEINYALEKIEQGEYGICERCNDEIDEARLDAIPYTRLCIECKRKEEEQ